LIIVSASVIDLANVFDSLRREGRASQQKTMI
jgi:hypothetical protein